MRMKNCLLISIISILFTTPVLANDNMENVFDCRLNATGSTGHKIEKTFKYSISEHEPNGFILPWHSHPQLAPLLQCSLPHPCAVTATKPVSNGACWPIFLSLSWSMDPMSAACTPRKHNTQHKNTTKTTQHEIEGEQKKTYLILSM